VSKTTPLRDQPGVEEAALDDLRGRLRRARWPERETVGDWSQGVPLGYLQELREPGPGTTTDGLPRPG
jgi:epoxide hydrolase